MRLTLLIAIAALHGAAFADPVPCTLDLQRSVPHGFTEGVLVCDGARVDGVWVQLDGSRISGVTWTEQQGDHLRRHFQLHADGRLDFVVEDRSIKGGFWKQTRGTSYILLPRGGEISVERDRDQLILHTPDGRTWQLAATRVDARRPWETSYAVTAIEQVSQRTVPIRFTERGIAGIDLAAVHALFLERHEPNMSGLANRRSREFLDARSTFHDEKGHTCAVRNRELYVRDPAHDDPSDVMFAFADDGALAAFLGKACPALDVAALSAALEQAR